MMGPGPVARRSTSGAGAIVEAVAKGGASSRDDPNYPSVYGDFHYLESLQ